MPAQQHSEVGASGMERWENCPGSVNLANPLGSYESIYAAEGTVAHAVAQAWLDLKEKPDGAFIGREFEQGGHKIVVDEGMLEAVKVYVDTIQKETILADTVWIEKRFHLKKIDEACFGTADCVAYFKQSKTLVVYDYKHGAGVAVDVKENVQLMYYGLGALLTDELSKLPIKQIELVIVQPRCPHPDGSVRRYTMTPEQMLEFWPRLAAAVAATKPADAPLHAGDWCRWCPAAAVCPEIKKVANEQAIQIFSPQAIYDPSKLADALEWLPVLEGYAEALRKFAYAEAEHGRTPPRHKLVDKVARRKWKSDGEAETTLAMLFDDVHEPRKLLSPSKLEKLYGKKKIKKIIEPLCVKVSSGLALVHESDKREAAKKDPADVFNVIK